MFFKGRGFYLRGFLWFCACFFGIFGCVGLLAFGVWLLNYAVNGHAYVLCVPLGLFAGVTMGYCFLDCVFPKDVQKQKAYDKAVKEGRLEEWWEKERQLAEGNTVMVEKKESTELKPLVWKERKVNDIESNPLECWYAVGQVGTSTRLYTIQPQYPVKEGYITVSDSEPELYILFETLDGKHISVTRVPEEGYSWLGQRIWDDYTFDQAPSFVRAFKTLDEAKARAEIQRKAIANIIAQYLS